MLLTVAMPKGAWASHVQAGGETHVRLPEASILTRLGCSDLHRELGVRNCPELCYGTEYSSQLSQMILNNIDILDLFYDSFNSTGVVA